MKNELPPKVNDKYSCRQEEIVTFALILTDDEYLADECDCGSNGSHSVFPKPCIIEHSGKDKRYSSWRDNTGKIINSAATWIQVQVSLFPHYFLCKNDIGIIIRMGLARAHVVPF
jgi:hypothetical protein